MRVWVYAGGGHTEAIGLPRFLRRHFTDTTFHMVTPYRIKPGPNPKAQEGLQYSGDTGKNLARSIREKLAYWDGSAQVMLIIDDLDCDDAERRRTLLLEAAKSVPEGYPAPVVVIGLAAPEIEAWIIADWGNTMGKDFAPCSREVQKALEDRQIPLEQPEDFACIDREGQNIKLSALLKESVEACCIGSYSKAKDSPALLGKMNPESVAAKCPHFRKFWRELKRTLEPATT